jgi:hypothetical protein
MQAQQAGQQCAAAAAQKQRQPLRDLSGIFCGDTAPCLGRRRSPDRPRFRVRAHQELVVLVCRKQLVMVAMRRSRRGSEQPPDPRVRPSMAGGATKAVEVASTWLGAAVTRPRYASSADGGSSSSSTDGRASRSGQGDPLALTSGQGHALLANPGVRPHGSSSTRPARLSGDPDGLIVGVGDAGRHVLPDAGEERQTSRHRRPWCGG